MVFKISESAIYVMQAIKNYYYNVGCTLTPLLNDRKNMDILSQKIGIA